MRSLLYSEMEVGFSFQDFPRSVLDALDKRLESVAIKLALTFGHSDENKLTSLVFYSRHPERKGRKLVRGEPGFEQLSREWLEIRDRLVRPAMRLTTATPSPTGGCPNSPAKWAKDTLSKMMGWWNDKDTDPSGKKLYVGSTLREMTPKVFPGVPTEAIVGFCANGSIRENTTESVAKQQFHEIGLFGTEAGPRSGPAPNPNPKAYRNSWGMLAFDPTVKKLLGGRPATMKHNEWKVAIPDQVAVGLVNVRRQGRTLVDRLDPSIRPAVTTSSLFFIACCFMAWSAGTSDKRATGHLNRFKETLAAVPEAERWGAFLRAVAEGIRTGRLDLRGLKGHDNVAYSALRTWQKLAAGQLLAGKTGGPVSWFNTGLGPDEPSIAETITCAANAARRS